MKPVEAEHMKRNMSYSIYEYASRPFDEFKRNAVAVLEHHFNNHELCGPWCAYLKLEGDQTEQNKLRYRCKTKNAKLYSQMKVIHDKFTTDKSLREIHHRWHTNK